MQTAIGSDVNSYLSFKIGTEVFAVNVENVLNILEMTKITKLPKSPDFMKGVINHRGNVLPVIDSRLKFDIEAGEITSNTCIIVFEINKSGAIVNVGAVVDEVKEVLEIEKKSILQIPNINEAQKTDFLKGMYRTEDGFIMILDIEKVFVDNELLDIQNLTQGLDSTVASEAVS